MLNFDDYKKLLDRQKNNQDVREEAIQYNVIRVFLQSIFQEYDIEATSKQERASIHDYLDYCGSYIDDKTRKLKKWTPDLVIAKNWNWDNIKNDVEYKCVVEVKSPFLDPITGQKPEEYKCLDEVKSHLMAKKNNKVILTDGVTWAFYDKEHALNPLYDPITLGEIEYEMKVSPFRKNPILVRGSGNRPIIKGLIWKQGKVETVENEVINDIFGKPLEYEKEPEEFGELIRKLQEFIV
jgi:hypothetical protein